MNAPRKSRPRNENVLGTIRSPEKYQRYYIQDWTDQQVKDWWRRYQRIANKRLKRMSESEFRDNDVLRFRYKDKKGFKPVSGFKSVNELRGQIADMAAFIGSERTSVSGLKRIQSETIKTLHAAGYTKINANNLKQFGKFMENYRASSAHIYGSEQIAESFSTMKRLKISQRDIFNNFEWWAENSYKLEDMKKKRGYKLKDYISDLDEIGE